MYLESHYIRTYEPLVNFLGCPEAPKTCYRYMTQPVLSFSFLFSDRPAGIGKMMDSGRKLYLSLVVRKSIFGVSDQVVQPQKMARGLKFRIKVIEGLYYPCSENIVADQLRGYHEADLCLCFRKCKQPVFSQRGSCCPFYVVSVILGFVLFHIFFRKM